MGRLTKAPDITALTMVNSGLPAALMAEWQAGEERPFDPYEGPRDDDEF